jgi:hypothetical protein
MMRCCVTVTVYYRRRQQKKILLVEIGNLKTILRFLKRLKDHRL